MKVLKFGGSSVASAERYARVANIVRTVSAAFCERVAVVVSASGDTTDDLIAAGELAANRDASWKDRFTEIRDRHHSIVAELSGKPLPDIQGLLTELERTLEGISLVQEISPRSLDQIMSFGERLSANILALAICAKGGEAYYLDARSIIKTNSEFGSAAVDFESSDKLIRSHFSGRKEVAVTTGFIGSDENGVTTTLGRGGSDYTAAILGAALGAEEIQIWTDVNGVMTADPRRVPRAFPIPELSYEEAMELSHFGAKVIHPPTMYPALRAGIPITIRNTFQPDYPGTKICAQPAPSNHPVRGISSIDEVALCRLEGNGMVGVAGISSRLFGTLARSGISVILISQASSEHSICFAVQPEKAAASKKAIEVEFELEIAAGRVNPLVVETGHSIIAAVGENMRHTPGISGKLFQALGKNGINIAAIAQGSSELNISVVIPRADQSKALNSVHDAFFLAGIKTVNIFLSGVGKIGSALLQQLSSQAEYLWAAQGLEIKLCGVANSRKMFVNTNGISLSDWEHLLKSEGASSDPKKFVKTMLDSNVQNTIFVDCSASEDVSGCYEQVLSGSVSIVTPNKRANSGPYLRYKTLRDLAQKRNIKFLYETTVGAGLPVIGTLNDLICSGDKIVKIEAVLSGTLSFIFNTFSETSSFSSTVIKAKELGYTEPDPRDDLSGKDVARKLLILAREIGLQLEEPEVKVSSLVPPDCSHSSSVDQFLTDLRKHDADMEKLRSKADAEGKKLRYLAEIADGKAQVSLQAVSANHPFYSLSGSDNIISFTTTRYLERPLVVKGPGAGVDVTAAGVFADILRVSHYLS